MTDKKASDRVQTLLKEGISRGVYPGVSLLVAQGDQILTECVAGVADLDSHRPVSRETLWDIASLTKPLFAAAFLAWAQGEDFDLQSPIVFDRFSPFELLHHSSGLPAWVDLTEPSADFKTARCGVREAILASPLGSPGTTLYSDLGFILLGLWTEIATGIALDPLLNRYLLSPLAMAATQFSPLARGVSREQIAATRRDSRRGLLCGEVDDQNAAYLGGVAAHAGLFSTARDLHRFLIALYRGSSAKGGPLSGPLFETLYRTPPPFGRFRLGFDTPETVASQAGKAFPPETSIGHLGFTGCSFWIDLASGFSIIFLSNRVHPDPANEAIKTFRPHLHNELKRIFASARID